MPFRFTAEYKLAILEGDRRGHRARTAAGPPGTLCFTVPGVDKIGIVTTTGRLRLSKAKQGHSPMGITTGPDGNIWFTEYDWNSIARRLS